MFLQNMRDTSWIEYIAAATGIISVWFARNRSILVYPAGIVSVLLYVYLMFDIGFYANSLINFIYFLMSVYGWYNWNKSKDEQGGFVPSKIRKKDWKYFVAVFAVLFVVLYQLLKLTTINPYFFWDAFTTSIFILAMWLMATKKTENWLFWIIGDIICIPVFFIQGMVLTGFQYLVFLFIAISGYISWRKIMVKPEICSNV